MQVLLVLAIFQFNLEANANRNEHIQQDSRKLLPQLPPHPDTSFIIEFVADGVDQCKEMDQVVKRLEDDLKIKVRKISIGRRQDFLRLFDLVGGNEGGNLPFFYNRRTGQAICGPTPYANLKRLAMSNPSHLFYQPPTKLGDKNDYDPNKQRSIGLKNSINEKVSSTLSGIARKVANTISKPVKEN
jgi:hypothetical protein